MWLWNAVKTTVLWIANNILLINILLAIAIVFFQRRNPRTVWTWLFVLIFLPGIGFILYLIIGQNMHKNKMFKTKAIEDRMSAVIMQQEENIRKNEFTGLYGELEEYTDLVFYNLRCENSVYTGDNQVTVITDGKEKFASLIEDLKKAKRFIHMQYYIIRQDEVFEAIEEVLAQKVKEGVEVRLLYDSMGCTMGNRMKEKDWARIRSEGIQIAEFFPAFLKKFQLRPNYRNHRKIVVIDNEVAYVGGFNVGREYLGLDEKFGYWRDNHLRIYGSSVMDLQIRFILDWNYASKENLFLDPKFFARSHTDFGGNAGIQIVSSGPDSKTQNIRNNYLKLINKAKNNIYIQSPYFIPDDVILEAICLAAESGVDVRVMIPCKPDHPFVYWATYSYMEDLLEAGVKCYTYDNGFLHAKTVMVDGIACSVGSANMDIRSFCLNFEVNAVIYDPATTQKLEDYFIEDLRKSTRITQYAYSRRSLWIRFKEQISRLLSPIM